MTCEFPQEVAESALGIAGSKRVTEVMYVAADYHVFELQIR